MQTRAPSSPHQGWGSRWAPRSAAFVLSAFAAASVAYWALKWPVPQPDAASPPLSLAGSQIGSVNPVASARLMGASQANPNSASAPTRSAPAVNASSRMHLAGVVSTGRRAGVALIAIDGKPARPFAVGSLVDGDLRLLEVSSTQASLGPVAGAPASLVLQLPQRKPGS